MALSRGTIQFNFQKARQQADRLDELAGRLTKLTASEYAGAMQNISANWKGENASAYLSKGARLQGGDGKVFTQCSVRDPGGGQAYL